MSSVLVASAIVSRIRASTLNSIGDMKQGLLPNLLSRARALLASLVEKKVLVARRRNRRRGAKACAIIAVGESIHYHATTLVVGSL